MRMENVTVVGSGGVMLPGKLWLPETEPKALLQITHGMTEHIGRYTALAEALTAQGVAVAGFDLRGHGKNPGSADCASFGENGWKDSLEDMHLFYGELTQRFPEIPHIMLGFSLGSFLLREYLNHYDDKVDGAVIMGTGQQPGGILRLMMAIVKTQIKKAGFDQTTPLVKKLSFETYNKKFIPNRTDFDWLCSDESERESYMTDPLCRKSISSGLFWQLLDSMKRTGSRSAYDRWNKTMPVLLLSGQEDPVGDFGKGVLQVKYAMESAGLKEVTMHLFPDARHDLLHEESCGCAEDIRAILCEWIGKIAG